MTSACTTWTLLVLRSENRMRLSLLGPKNRTFYILEKMKQKFSCRKGSRFHFRLVSDRVVSAPSRLPSHTGHLDRMCQTDGRSGSEVTYLWRLWQPPREKRERARQFNLKGVSRKLLVLFYHYFSCHSSFRVVWRSNLTVKRPCEVRAAHPPVPTVSKVKVKAFRPFLTL